MSTPTRRSPTRGAWIETLSLSRCWSRSKVAPPRGERGLKRLLVRAANGELGRSPTRGAWIETYRALDRLLYAVGRSPTRGAWIETFR